MLVFPPCKINLGLYITRRREDGYHDLETVFYPASSVKDALEAVPAQGEPTLHLSGKAVAGNKEDNLVWKAYQLLQHEFPEKVPSLDWYLHKAIPMGAGLGGGSADGAFALRLLNDYCHLQLSEERLIALALQLGSDCPFFIRNSPQFAEGRGEKMEAVGVDLSNYEIRIVTSEVHVSTGKAFQMLTPKPAPFDLRQLASLPITEWKDRIGNDFEEPVFAQHPELRATKERLYAEGALYAQMSGSGSAVFGVFGG